MAAHAIHFGNGRAALQQSAVYRLLVGKRQRSQWHRKQGRATARDERDHEVVCAKAFDEFQHALCCIGTGLIGHGMAGLDDFYVAGFRTVAVACDYETAERSLPMRLERPRHFGGGLACTDDQRAPLRRRRQQSFDCLHGIGGGDSRVEQGAQEGFRFHGLDS
jgi:hypothetical protein